MPPAFCKSRAALTPAETVSSSTSTKIVPVKRYRSAGVKVFTETSRYAVNLIDAAFDVSADIAALAFKSLLLFAGGGQHLLDYRIPDARLAILQ